MMQPSTRLGATNQIAATHGVLNRGCVRSSTRGHRRPRAPANSTRAVCVFAEMYDEVRLIRKIATRNGTAKALETCRNRTVAVANGFGSFAKSATWLTPNAETTA